MKYITLVMLKQADACADQQELFKATFGEEAELTEANMAKAVEADLDFGWLTVLLPQTAREAYGVKVTPLWKAHKEKHALLLGSYTVQSAALREAYDVQRDALWDALWDSYNAQRGTLLLNALIAA